MGGDCRIEINDRALPGGLVCVCVCVCVCVWVLCVCVCWCSYVMKGKAEGAGRCLDNRFNDTQRVGYVRSVCFPDGGDIF